MGFLDRLANLASGALDAISEIASSAFHSISEAAAGVADSVASLADSIADKLRGDTEDIPQEIEDIQSSSEELSANVEDAINELDSADDYDDEEDYNAQVLEALRATDTASYEELVKELVDLYETENELGIEVFSEGDIPASAEARANFYEIDEAVDYIATIGAGMDYFELSQQDGIYTVWYVPTTSNTGTNSQAHIG